MSQTQQMKLHPPHGFADVTVPDRPLVLRQFFERCLETREFHLAGSEREQVHLVHQWAQNSYPDRLTLQQIADFFEVGKSTISHHLSRSFVSSSPVSPSKNGRPSALNDDELNGLCEFIRERFAQRYPVSFEDCRDFLDDRYKVQVHIKTLRGIIDRSAIFKTVTGVPMEDCRNFSSPDEIDDFFSRLREVLDVGEILAPFVINVDETGFQEFVDARRGIRIVPANYEFNSVPVPVTRSEKRATLIAAISADGSSLRPMVVLPRVTMESELLLRGYTEDKVQYGRSETGFVNRALFTDWVRYTLVPEIRWRRNQHQYSGPALVLLDGFQCHQSEDICQMCEEENIIFMFFPPHTSDQLQPCDLGLFSNQKRWSSNIQIDPQLNRQTRQVIRIVDSFRMAATFKNVTGAFRKAGIVTFLDEKLRLRVRVDTDYASSVRHLHGDHTLPLEGDRRRVRI